MLNASNISPTTEKYESASTSSADNADKITLRGLGGMTLRFFEDDNWAEGLKEKDPTEDIGRGGIIEEKLTDDDDDDDDDDEPEQNA